MKFTPRGRKRGQDAARRPVVACAFAARFALLLGLLLIGFGCEKHEEQSEKPTTRKVEGVSEEHLVRDDGPRYAPKAAQPVAFVAKTPAPKPTTQLAPNTSCVTAECHSTYATAKYVHGPVSEKACNACHQDDIGGHKYPLKRTPVATCTFCHAVVGTQSHQHKAMDKGCVACHRPHESNAKFLLIRDNVERVCATCHDLPMKKFAHDPFAKGDCTVCHQAHQSPNDKLLRGGEGPEHCFSCHTNVKKAMTTAIKAHEPAQKACVTCHAPHATEFNHQLKAEVQQTCTASCHEPIKQKVQQASVQHQAVVMNNSCTNCHDAHGTTSPKLLKARMDAVCMTCHNKPVKSKDGREIPDMTPVITDAKFKHGPILSGDCSSCHDAHGGSNFALLKKPFPRTFYTSFAVEQYALCFSCHDKRLVETEKAGQLTGFRDGDRNLHFLHVNRDDKGRTCKACHAIHGSDLPNHISEEVTFERSKWAMPMNFVKTTDGGSCMPGCHKMYSYDRLHPTTRPVTQPATQPSAGFIYEEDGLPTTSPTTLPTSKPTTRGAQ